MTANTTFDENAGINKLANVLIERMKKENESPLCLDFGEIQANGSLITNTFPVSIPKGQYCVCRQLTLGTVEDELVKTEDDGIMKITVVMICIKKMKEHINIPF